MPLCVRCQCLNQYDRHVHVTRLSKILVFQFASLSFLLAFSPPAVSKCFRRDSLRSYDRRLLSGVRAASYAQALQGLRTETCGCGTLRIGKACRLSLATRSSSRICVMNPPSVTSVVQSSYTFSINQRCVSESCQVFQIVRRHTINSTAHPRGEAKLRMQRRLFPKRGCPFNPSLHTGCCTDVTTVVKSLQPIKYTGCCDSCCTDVTTARDA